MRFLAQSDAAVSDVVGSILLVAVTVASFAGLGTIVHNIPAPADQLYAHLKTEANAGPDRLWGTGDEEIRVRSLYGESIPEAGTTIMIRQNGFLDQYTGSQLDFLGDSLDLGEVWVLQRTLNYNDEILVSLAVTHGNGARLLSSDAVITGQTPCTMDTTPPVAVIQQDPPDLGVLSGTKPLNVTARLMDACNPIDAAVQPLFEYNLGTGSPATMTPQGGDVWNVSIPPPGGNWATVVHETFVYQVTNMADLVGNVGDSVPRSDFIEPIPPKRTYVNTTSAVFGTVTDLGAAKDDNDLNAAATLTEGPGGGTGGTLALYGDSIVVADRWEKPERAADGLNAQHAKYKTDPPSDPLVLSLPDPAASTNQILRVTIKGTGFIRQHVNDGWQTNACTSIGCTQVSGTLVSAAGPTNTEFSYDITNKRPGGGAWTWSDITELSLRVYPKVVYDPVNLNTNDGDWNLDALWAEVDHGPDYEMNIHLLWDQAPGGPQHNLELNYLTDGGTFRVQAFNPILGTWKTLGTLESPFLKAWSAPLSSNEWNSGNPTIRVKTLATAPGTPSSVHLEYARVTS